MMVYIIRADAEARHQLGGLCKIGMTGNLPRRLATIQTYCPFPVVLVGALRCAGKKQAAELERVPFDRIPHYLRAQQRHAKTLKHAYLASGGNPLTLINAWR